MLPQQLPRGLASTVIMLSSALAACSASHDDEVKSSAMSFASAAAGGNMALHQWLDGSLPTHFAERALGAASHSAADRMKDLATALIQARQDPGWPMARMGVVLAALGSADAGLSRS